MKHDVITFGSATRDIFVRSNEFEIHESEGTDHHLETCFPLGAKIDVQEMVFETGGGATNAAVTFNNLGWKTATVAAVGNDLVGKQVKSELVSMGISSALLQVLPNATTSSSVIILSGSGERTILIHRGTKAFDAQKIVWSKINAKWFYCTSFGGDLKTMRKIISHAKKHGTKISWNPGNKEISEGLIKLKPLIKQVDILNLNKEEATMLSGRTDDNFNDVLNDLRMLPKKAVVITDGNMGAYIASKNEAWHSGIVDVTRINTTGAGDAFGSGLIAGLMKKPDDLGFALATGSWNATEVVQTMGAKMGLLTKYPSDKKVNQIKIRKLEIK